MPFSALALGFGIPCAARTAARRTGLIPWFPYFLIDSISSAIVRPQESIFALSRSIATRSPANLPLSAITHLLKPGSDQYPVIYHFRGIGSHAIWKHFRVFRQTRTWTVCTRSCEEEQQQDTAWSAGEWCVLKWLKPVPLTRDLRFLFVYGKGLWP